MWFAAVPDLRSTVEGMIAEWDTVAVRWTSDGTHRGELLSIPASGHRFQFMGSVPNR